MSDPEAKHVFISYVREDSGAVDGLCAVLEAAEIPYWRDRSALGPGDAWRVKIRQAIRTGSLVFLACISDSSRAKQKSYMNEELTLAVEEFRQMPPGRTWLIPVRFNEGDVPEWDLGAGRVLGDLNYSDLFGPHHMANAARLVTAIHRLMDEQHPDPATTRAAIEQIAEADRADALKRLTKEMLLEPSRRIELDDLVSQEVQRILAVLQDKERVAGPLKGTNEEQIVALVGEARDHWSLVKPFCASLQVAARWGEMDSLTPWASGLRALVAAATKPESGTTALLEMRHLSGMSGIMTAAIACVSTGKWGNLKTLVVDQMVKDRYENKQLAIIEATDPYKPFKGTIDIVPHTLAYATVQDRVPLDVLRDLTTNKLSKYYTPMAEWLHHVLRPIFADQLPDEDSYSAEFDRAEAVLSALAQDAVAARTTDSRGWLRSYWYGRAIWRAAHDHGNPINDLIHEIEAQGNQWAPLKAGLFGGDQARARAALDTSKAAFEELAKGRW